MNFIKEVPGMDDIEVYRKQLDEIDQEMRKLFIQRMETVAKVAHWKSVHNFPIFDSTREASMIKINIESIESPEFRKYYEEFLMSILKVSKEYQVFLLSRGVL